MALNRLWPELNNMSPAVKALAQTAARTTNIPISGDPCRVGQIPGTAVIDFDATTKQGVMQFDGIYSHLVAGIDSSGVSGADANVAVNGGDKIYFDESKTPPLSKRAGGVPFGYAFGDSGVQLVAAGATTTAIPVKVRGF